MFKYYHGTSTIFTDSIKQTGLSGINPNLQWKNLDLLRFLANETENQIPKNEYYVNNKLTITAMVNQQNIETLTPTGKRQMCYFQHYGIYIALSLQRAIVYATVNKFGSEILQTSVNLFNELRKFDNKLVIPSELDLINIEKISQTNPEPIIIEISNVNDEDLLKEDGKTAKESLDFLRMTIPFLSEKEKHEFFQYCNFELLKPIPLSNLKFYKLKTKGSPGSPDFTYELL